jgi:hypothetical protein
MIRGMIVLGDFAELDTGSRKLHVLGAGWSEIGPAPTPHAVIVVLKLPSERSSAPIDVLLRLTDAAGEVVMVPGTAGFQRLEVNGQMQVQPPTGWNEPEVDAVFCVNIGALQLTPGRSYKWTAEIDTKEIASTTFIVRSQPATRPIAGTDAEQPPPRMPSL